MNEAASRLIQSRVERLRRFRGAGTLIELSLPGAGASARAGQFVQVACGPASTFRLHRPFSIARSTAVPGGQEIGILFSVVGEGSEWLDARRPGDTVSLVGPLGRPFLAVPGRIPVLVGGGRGVAPLLFLADQLATDHPDGYLLYGARDADALFPTEGSPYLVDRATLDGSAGHAGTVIDLLESLLQRGAIRSEGAALYGCGPMPMLEVLSGVAARHGMPVQVSIETMFGCGTGLCAGCAVPLLPRSGEAQDDFHRYAFACTDGPVFDGHRVDWKGAGE